MHSRPPAPAVPTAEPRPRKRPQIDNVVLDSTGGSLSLAQLLLDACCANDFSAISGDPVKFGLGLSSLVFDAIFILQHCVLYRRDRTSRTDREQALLTNDFDGELKLGAAAR